MADREIRKIAASRHYYAESGRDYKVKRKFSGDKEESLEKRERKSTQENHQTCTSSSTDSLEVDKMSTKNMEVMIEEIVSRVTEAMKKQNEESTNKILDEINGRMKKIEEKDTEQDEEIEDLKRRMDEHDQREKVHR
jgi:hypothetical protein